MHLQQHIMEKLANGDHLSTYELEAGMGYHYSLHVEASKAGPTYKLMADASLRTYHTLHSYYHARKDKVA